MPLKIFGQSEVYTWMVELGVCPNSSILNTVSSAKREASNLGNALRSQWDNGIEMFVITRRYGSSQVEAGRLHDQFFRLLVDFLPPSHIYGFFHDTKI